MQRFSSRKVHILSPASSVLRSGASSVVREDIVAAETAAAEANQEYWGVIRRNLKTALNHKQLALANRRAELQRQQQLEREEVEEAKEAPSPHEERISTDLPTHIEMT